MVRRMPELGVELLLAAALLLFVAAGTVIEVRYPPYPVPVAAGAYAVAVASCLVLILRRRFPLAVIVAGIALLAVYRVAGYPGGAPALSLFVSFYSFALYRLSRATFVLAALLIVAEVLVFELPPHRTPWYSFAVLGPAFGLAWMVVLGGAAGFRRRAAEERVRQAAVTAEARLRERLADERLRIARELHDVLAHTISVIAVQSGAALDSLDSEPERTRAALQVVRTAAKQAMPELRAALGLLRSDGDAPERFAQPTLDQLDELVEHARAAGLRVTVSAGALELPAFLGLTAYRIVQEALTNVVRHASASAVHVAIARSSDGVRIDVSDDGAGTAPASGAGLGLAGMRERVALVGGTVTAGPGPSGGWLVHADLPLEGRT